MFPLHPTEDLSTISSDLKQPLQHQLSASTIPQDLILFYYDHHHHCAHNPLPGFGFSSDGQVMLPDHEHQPPSPNQPLPDDNSNKGDDGDGDEQNKKKKKKKNIHREIERQRRLEMNALYASLRSLLPLQFLKGKRAVSDQLNAALDYINWLQKNIKELETKRAKLKRTSNQLTGNNDALQENHPVIGRSSIAVQPYSRGVKVVVHSSHREKSLPLSRAIEVLMHEEMDVVSCTTTRIKDATIHTIQSETRDSTILDVSRLQQKFNELLSSPLS